MSYVDLNNGILTEPFASYLIRNALRRQRSHVMDSTVCVTDFFVQFSEEYIDYYC